MKIPTLLIAGTVALSGLLIAAPAEADDHRHHGNHNDRHSDHRYHGEHFRGGSYTSGSYYYSQPEVIYDQPYMADRYYGGPNVSVAFGGHGRDWRHDRHHHHH